MASGGSTPARGAPTGTASGDLSGTYPAPTVAKVNGIAVTGTPSTGYVPTATSASAATWQAVSASPPHTQEMFFGPTTSVNNNAQVALSWGASSGPDSLLNVTAPTLPTVITSGTYAVTVQLSCNDFTVGGYLKGRLELDVAGADVELDTFSAPATASDSPAFSMSLTWYLTAGMQLKVTVQNKDGVAARDVYPAIFVQRLG